MKKIKVNPIHEQVILGTMIRDNKLRKSLCKTLNISDFFLQQHRLIFAALQYLEDERLDYTPSTLKSFLPPDQDWGGIQYFDKLIQLASDKNITFHIEQAKWDTIRNTLLIDKLPALTALLQDTRTTSDDITKTFRQLEDLSRVDNDKSIVSGKSHIAKYNAELYARSSGSNIRTTGYMELDKKLTSPCKPKWISVVAAAPSIGKTTFCLNMAARQSARWKVGYLAWESGAVSATDILCASELQIPLSTLLKHPDTLTQQQIHDKNQLLENLFDTDNMFSFLNRPPKNIIKQRSPWEVNNAVLDWIDAKLESWNIDILYWDLFEKQLPDRHPQAIGWALDRVQEIAQNHNIHIILLHQIKLKDVEKQADKRPMRHNLKGTGGYIETPDFVFGLYRKAVYERGIVDNELELYCLKQRFGPWPFRIIFEWEGQYCRVSRGREVQITFTSDEEYATQV